MPLAEIVYLLKEGNPQERWIVTTVLKYLVDIIADLVPRCKKHGDNCGEPRSAPMYTCFSYEPDMNLLADR